MTSEDLLRWMGRQAHRCDHSTSDLDPERAAAEMVRELRRHAERLGLPAIAALCPSLERLPPREAFTTLETALRRFPPTEVGAGGEDRASGEAPADEAEDSLSIARTAALADVALWRVYHDIDHDRLDAFRLRGWWWRVPVGKALRYAVWSHERTAGGRGHKARPSSSGFARPPRGTPPVPKGRGAAPVVAQGA